QQCQDKHRLSSGTAGISSSSKMTIPFPTEREQAKFQRALDFLTERVSEGRLDIILSYESFLALEQKKIEYFGDISERWIRFKYVKSDHKEMIGNHSGLS
ncbi:hypothetical protein V1522DRAFT_414568, partial [Lipomyces starkeyi]